MIWALVVFLGAQPQTAAVGFPTKAACQAIATRLKPKLLAAAAPADRSRLRVACYQALPLAHGDPRST